jgi:hypothetical protein
MVIDFSLSCVQLTSRGLLNNSRITSGIKFLTSDQTWLCMIADKAYHEMINPH